LLTCSDPSSPSADLGLNGSRWERTSLDVVCGGYLTCPKSETKIGSVWNQVDRWAYTWTTRDQMGQESVIPTEVGIYKGLRLSWIPAFACMTKRDTPNAHVGP
jgi:hypothetical protein